MAVLGSGSLGSSLCHFLTQVTLSRSLLPPGFRLFLGRKGTMTDDDFMGISELVHGGTWQELHWVNSDE